MNGSQFHIVKCSNRLKIIATPCYDLNRCAKRKGCLLQTTSDYVICKQTVIFKLSHHNSIIIPPFFLIFAIEMDQNWMLQHPSINCQIDLEINSSKNVPTKSNSFQIFN